ncbi:hypothetical protein SNEBB_010595, partial [Seison nebaliae]
NKTNSSEDKEQEIVSPIEKKKEEKKEEVDSKDPPLTDSIPNSKQEDKPRASSAVNGHSSAAPPQSDKEGKSDQPVMQGSDVSYSRMSGNNSAEIQRLVDEFDLPDIPFPMEGKGISTYSPFEGSNYDSAGNMMREGHYERELLKSIDFGNEEEDGTITTMVARRVGKHRQKIGDYPICADFRAWCKADAPCYVVDATDHLPTINIEYEDLNALFRNPALPIHAPMNAHLNYDPVQAAVKYLHLSVEDATILSSSFWLSSQRYFNSYLYEKIMCLVMTKHLAEKAGSVIRTRNVMPDEVEYLERTEPGFASRLAIAISSGIFIFVVDRYTVISDLAILACVAREGIMLEFENIAPRVSRIKHVKIPMAIIFLEAGVALTRDAELALPCAELIYVYMRILALKRKEKTDCLVGVETASLWIYQVVRPTLPLTNNEVYGFTGAPIVIEESEVPASPIDGSSGAVFLTKEDLNKSFITSFSHVQTPRMERHRAAKSVAMQALTKSSKSATTGDVKKKAYNRRIQNETLASDKKFVSEEEVAKSSKNSATNDPERVGNDKRCEQSAKDAQSNSNIQILSTGRPNEMPTDHQAYVVEEKDVWFTPLCEITTFRIKRMAPHDYNVLFRLIPIIYDQLTEQLEINDEWNEFVKYDMDLMIRLLLLNGALIGVSFGLFNLEWNITGFDYNRVAMKQNEIDGGQNTANFFFEVYFKTEDGLTNWIMSAVWSAMNEHMNWTPQIFSLGCPPFYNHFNSEQIHNYTEAWAAVFHHTIVCVVPMLFGSVRFNGWPNNLGIIQRDFCCDSRFGNTRARGEVGWTTAVTSTSYSRAAMASSVWKSARYVPEMIFALNAICQQLDIWNTTQRLIVSMVGMEMVRSMLPERLTFRYPVELDADNFYPAIQTIIPGSIRTYDWYTGYRIIPWLLESQNRRMWPFISSLQHFKSDVWDSVGLERMKWYVSMSSKRLNRDLSSEGGPQNREPIRFRW